MPFLFLKLDVYQQANHLVGELSRFTKELGSNEAELIDQLKRASLSIPTNIAEGYGRWHSKDKNRFYVIALGSTTECASLITSAVTKGLLDDSRYERWLGLLDRIAQMIQGLIASVAGRDS